MVHQSELIAQYQKMETRHRQQVQFRLIVVELLLLPALVSTSGWVLFCSVSRYGSVCVSVLVTKCSDLLQVMTKMFLNNFSVAPVHFRLKGQRSRSRTQNADIVIGRNSASNGPIYFEKRSKCTKFGNGLLLCLTRQIFWLFLLLMIHHKNDSENPLTVISFLVCLGILPLFD